MTTQNNLSSKFRSSFLVALSSMLIIVLAISCTDVDDGGITNTEFQQAQVELSNQQSNAPFYVINGEPMAGNESNNGKLARIKPKYIKSINILKGVNATDKYGNRGGNGVIEIQFIDGIDRETVFSDLKEEVDANAPVPPLPPKKEDYYIAVETMPELIGGLESIQKDINYPKEAQEAGIEGRVIVQFIIDKEGNVVNPQIMKGVDKSLDEETLRVVKQAKFIPGKQGEKPVRVQYSLPITYKLPSDKKAN